MSCPCGLIRAEVLSARLVGDGGVCTAFKKGSRTERCGELLADHPDAAGQTVHDLISLEYEKQKTLTIQKSLISLKAGMLTKRISARKTETITTPVEPADRPPFVNTLVVGMSAMDFEEGTEEPHVSTSPEDSVLLINYSSPALFPELKADEHWSAKEKEDCKRFVELLRSVVGVRGMKVALYPAGCPITVNILYGRGQSRELCHYCPSATFNAYSYLAKVCGADAYVLVKNIADRAIANCKDYYAEKLSNKPGTSPPPYKVPR